MKKHLILLSALALAFTLAGCTADTPTPEPAPAPGQSPPQGTPPIMITDISDPAVGIHEEIVEQSFAEGEDIDNLYYKRSANSDGVPVYTVTRKSDGQTDNLPLTETDDYVPKTGPSDYEKVTVSYKENGDPSSIEQYELYVQSTEEEPSPLSPEDHPDVSVSSSVHSENTSNAAGKGTSVGASPATTSASHSSGAQK